MKHERAEDRLPGRWLRRVGERIASRATCERVLSPLLADLQFEHARARGRWARVALRARGVLAFWRALGVTTVLDAGQQLWAHAWATGVEEPYATKRLFAILCGATTATALALLAPTWPRLRLFPDAIPFVLPSVFSVAIPVGVLFAFAIRAVRPSTLAGWKGLAGVAVLAALATFVVDAWIMPAGNQEYRERIYRAYFPAADSLLRGDREMTLKELRVRSAELRSIGRGEEAARFDVEWHKKPALAALCLAFALAGATISATTRRGVFRFCAALVVGWVPWTLLGVGEQAADNGHLSPALAMWGPVVLVGAAALAALRLAQHRGGTETGPHGPGTAAASS